MRAWTFYLLRSLCWPRRGVPMRVLSAFAFALVVNSFAVPTRAVAADLLEECADEIADLPSDISRNDFGSGTAELTVGHGTQTSRVSRFRLTPPRFDANSLPPKDLDDLFPDAELLLKAVRACESNSCNFDEMRRSWCDLAGLTDKNPYAQRARNACSAWSSWIAETDSIRQAAAADAKKLIDYLDDHAGSATAGLNLARLFWNKYGMLPESLTIEVQGAYARLWRSVNEDRLLLGHFNDGQRNWRGARIAAGMSYLDLLTVDADRLAQSPASAAEIADEVTQTVWAVRGNLVAAMAEHAGSDAAVVASRLALAEIRSVVQRIVRVFNPTFFFSGGSLEAAGAKTECQELPVHAIVGRGNVGALRVGDRATKALGLAGQFGKALLTVRDLGEGVVGLTIEVRNGACQALYVVLDGPKFQRNQPCNDRCRMSLLRTPLSRGKVHGIAVLTPHLRHQSGLGVGASMRQVKRTLPNIRVGESEAPGIEECAFSDFAPGVSFCFGRLMSGRYAVTEIWVHGQ